MTFLRHLPLFLLLLSAVHGEEGQVLARAGQAEVTIAEVRASLETLDARQLAAVRQDAALLEQVSRSFIVQRLVLQQALASKWDEEPQVIAKLQRARDSALTESYLESVSQPPAHFPDEDELKAAYETRKAALLIPRAFRLAQVFIAGSDDKARKQAASATDSAFTELGWLTENQIQPEIRTHLPLKPLAVSQPIQLNDGWHVFKVLEVRPARTPALDEVRAQLRLTLRSERQRDNAQAWLATFLKDHPINLDKAALSRTLPQNVEPTPQRP